MDLWVRLGVNLPLDRFVSELCGDLDVVIDEGHDGVSRRVLETLHEDHSHGVDVKKFGRSSWRRSNQRELRIPSDFGDNLAQDTQATEMHLLRALASADVGLRIDLVPCVTHLDGSTSKC